MVRKHTHYYKIRTVGRVISKNAHSLFMMKECYECGRWWLLPPNTVKEK